MGTILQWSLSTCKELGPCPLLTIYMYGYPCSTSNMFRGLRRSTVYSCAYDELPRDHVSGVCHGLQKQVAS